MRYRVTVEFVDGHHDDYPCRSVTMANGTLQVHDGDGDVSHSFHRLEWRRYEVYLVGLTR